MFASWPDKPSLSRPRARAIHRCPPPWPGVGSPSTLLLALLYWVWDIVHLRPPPPHTHTDWAGPLDGPAWDVDQSVVLCGALRDLGCDLIDVSSGGQLPRALIPVGPGYQVTVRT